MENKSKEIPDLLIVIESPETKTIKEQIEQQILEDKRAGKPNRLIVISSEDLEKMEREGFKDKLLKKFHEKAEKEYDESMQRQHDILMRAFERHKNDK